DRRDTHEGPPDSFAARLDVGVWRGVLRSEDAHAAEFQQDQNQEDDDPQRIVGAMPDHRPENLAISVSPQQATDAHHPEQTEDLELREGQAAQEVEPPAAVDEVRTARVVSSCA